MRGLKLHDHDQKNTIIWETKKVHFFSFGFKLKVEGRWLWLAGWHHQKEYIVHSMATTTIMLMKMMMVPLFQIHFLRALSSPIETNPFSSDRENLSMKAMYMGDWLADWRNCMWKRDEMRCDAIRLCYCFINNKLQWHIESRWVDDDDDHHLQTTTIYYTYSTYIFSPSNRPTASNRTEWSDPMRCDPMKLYSQVKTSQPSKAPISLANFTDRSEWVKLLKGVPFNVYSLILNYFLCCEFNISLKDT